MNEKRKYKRFTLDVLEVNGMMLRATNVKVIDISLGGISIKVDRRLNIGTDYLLKLSDRREVLSLKGTVIRSLLIESKKTASGDLIPIYQTGLAFSGLTEKDTTLLDNLIERYRVDTSPVPQERRCTVRFNIETQEKALLQYPENFKVRQISLGGMLIDSDHKMETNSKTPMQLFSDNVRPIRFIGRVVFCRVLEQSRPTLYAAGIEFLDLTERGRELLASFIEYFCKSGHGE